MQVVHLAVATNEAATVFVKFTSHLMDFLDSASLAFFCSSAMNLAGQPIDCKKGIHFTVQLCSLCLYPVRSHSGQTM